MTSKLFIGQANTAPCWYRCALPAYSLGIDWIGVAPGKDDPTELLFAGNMNEVPDFAPYDTIVIQQPKGNNWNKRIKEWQSEGKTVLFEVDDFLHGIKKIEDHKFKSGFHKKNIKAFQETMGICDGMICSTEFLSDQYSKYNPNQHVCNVGIDTERYVDIEFPEREHFVIGWAGGTGHAQAVTPWLKEIMKILDLYEKVVFISIGEPYGLAVNHLLPGKGLFVPWTNIENLPYALTNLDCFIAPSHTSKYFKSKSDLRWLEASAVGIPGVVDPNLYPDAQDGSTALIADTPADAADAIMELIEDRDLGAKISQNAKEYIVENKDISVKSDQWRKALKLG